MFMSPMSEQNLQLLKKFDKMQLSKISDKQIIECYDECANDYDELVVTLNSFAQRRIAEIALELSPGSPKDVRILDVGSGTGLVGEELQKKGFTNIDGLDPSVASLDMARKKGIYGKLIPGLFTDKPQNIPKGILYMFLSTMSEQNFQLLKKFDQKQLSKLSDEQIIECYDECANDYERVMSFAKRRIAEKVLEFSPGSPKDVRILDVGSGTGLVGEELQKEGFTNIDGLDPSVASLDMARKKGIYGKLIPGLFTDKPQNIPKDTYDMIVTCGTFIRGHLQLQCLQEMIRLVRKGGRICIVTRASSFDGGKTVPEYTNFLQIIKRYEEAGSLKLVKWMKVPDYMSGCEGVGIIFEVLV